MSNWNVNISGFKSFLQLEKSLSHNSIDAYLRDVGKIKDYAERELDIQPENLSLEHLQSFLADLNSLNISARSQARIISGIKAFYKYLLLENLIDYDPTELLETPRLGRKLPDTLSIEEIDKISAAVDLSQALGHRNKAIIETLYGCGLRVSELIDMQLSNCYFDEGFVRIRGKGDKERLVPISKYTIKFIQHYVNGERQDLKVHPDHEDFIFLNRRGKQLTRVMIFTIVKNLVKAAGIQKNISPHTFRHSFATHLVDGGADLRAVQEMLGHQSITTTEIYTHLDTNFLKQNIIDYHPRSNN